jgi:hypothetical protein
MSFRSLVSSLLLLGILHASARAEELSLPADVVNVAFPEFGDAVGLESDYGLANITPVEVIREGEPDQETRIVRTPRELRLSRLRAKRYEAHFQVKVGQVNTVYFWLEAPPVLSQWSVTLTVVYPDGSRETVFDANVKPEVTNYVLTAPGVLLDFRVSSVEQTFKLSKRFLFTVSPARFSLWPNFRPIPYRTLWD